MNNLPDGVFVVGNKLMAQCETCGKIVRLDKPLLGSLHVCNGSRNKELQREFSKMEGQENYK